MCHFETDTLRTNIIRETGRCRISEKRTLKRRKEQQNNSSIEHSYEKYYLP